MRIICLLIHSEMFLPSLHESPGYLYVIPGRVVKLQQGKAPKGEQNMVTKGTVVIFTPLSNNSLVLPCCQLDSLCWHGPPLQWASTSTRPWRRPTLQLRQGSPPTCPAEVMILKVPAQILEPTLAGEGQHPR
jgi:hypothetical protein